jgi:hypothetical protein
MAIDLNGIYSQFFKCKEFVTYRVCHDFMVLLWILFLICSLGLTYRVIGYYKEKSQNPNIEVILDSKSLGCCLYKLLKCVFILFIIRTIYNRFYLFDTELSYFIHKISTVLISICLILHIKDLFTTGEMKAKKYLILIGFLEILSLLGAIFLLALQSRKQKDDSDSEIIEISDFNKGKVSPHIPEYPQLPKQNIPKDPYSDHNDFNKDSSSHPTTGRYILQTCPSGYKPQGENIFYLRNHTNSNKVNLAIHKKTVEMLNKLNSKPSRSGKPTLP